MMWCRVSLPPDSALEGVLVTEGALSARLVGVVVDAWSKVPEARPRLLLLLSAFA